MFPVVLFVAWAGVSPVDDDALVCDGVEEVAGDAVAGKAGMSGGEFGGSDEGLEHFVDEFADGLFFLGVFEDRDDGGDGGGDSRG